MPVFLLGYCVYAMSRTLSSYSGRSGKLLLTLPCQRQSWFRAPWPYFCSFQDFYMFRNGVSNSTRRGVSLPLATHPLLRVTHSLTGPATHSVTTRLPRGLLAPCILYSIYYTGSKIELGSHITKMEQTGKQIKEILTVHAHYAQMEPLWTHLRAEME